MLELFDEAFKAAIIHMLHEVMVNRFEMSGRTEVLSREIKCNDFFKAQTHTHSPTPLGFGEIT